MLRIRFGKECVTVAFNDEQGQSAEMSQRYDKVEVELLVDDFWHHVKAPVDKLKAGLYLSAAVRSVSEGTRQEGQGTK